MEPAYSAAVEHTITAPLNGSPNGTTAAVPAPVARRRGRPRDTSADERILQAAGRLILERGFDKVTVDDVASMARAGKATVYRRWASKEDLAVAALELLYRQELPMPDTGSVRKDLGEYFRHVLDFVNSPSGAAFIRMSMGEALRDPRIAALYESATASQERHVHALLQRGIERGEIRADAPVEYAVNWLSGMVAVRCSMGRQQPTSAEVDDMIDFLFNGIRA